MALNNNRLAELITQSIVSELQLGQSNPQLERYSLAIARAFNTYLQENVEVAVGIQVEGQATFQPTGTGGGGTETTQVGVVKAKTVTKGKII